MDIREAVGRIPVLHAANPAALAALIPCFSLKRCSRGEHLFLEREQAESIYFLAEGTACLYKLSDDQDKKVIFLYGTGAMLNEELLDEKPASVYCELLSDAWILCIDRQRFLYICRQDFELTKAVMDAMSLKIRRMYRQIKNTSNAVRGDRKIASRLWKLSRDHGVPCEQGTRINFELTITFLAELLGSRRETVSRQLKLLTEKGLVIIDKNHFIIPNRDELKKYFEES